MEDSNDDKPKLWNDLEESEKNMVDAINASPPQIHQIYRSMYHKIMDNYTISNGELRLFYGNVYNNKNCETHNLYQPRLIFNQRYFDIVQSWENNIPCPRIIFILKENYVRVHFHNIGQDQRNAFVEYYFDFKRNISDKTS